MNIHHEPIFNLDKVIEHYTIQDGVPIKYVCTTALDGGLISRDVFYRDTPHPEYGNRYFALMPRGENVYICDADYVEELDFGMIEVDGTWYYSSHRHDYKAFGEKSIDGGRAYLRGFGFEVFKIKDGEFVKDEN